MKNPLRTPEDYELFIYTIAEKFPSVLHSTLTFIRKGSSLAKVSGELLFEQEIRLIIRERILYDRLPVVIDWYGYEIWQRDKKLFWYDSQPHPNDLNLQSTHPHHKHIPPDIKHNRIPASEMSFTRPNIIKLIHEIETIIK
ncbi:hypothetical protein H8E88_06075 [candidate division KSB1 bacterium]|nr:hypothetical protein [candidate division KSB1 bacterium]